MKLTTKDKEKEIIGNFYVAESNEPYSDKIVFYKMKDNNFQIAIYCGDKYYNYYSISSLFEDIENYKILKEQINMMKCTYNNEDNCFKQILKTITKRSK